MLLKELQKHCDVILRHRVESHVSTIMVEHSEIIRLGEVDRSHIHPDLAEIFTHTYIHTYIHSASGHSSDFGYSESMSSSDFISYTRPAAQPNPLQQQVHTYIIHTYMHTFIHTYIRTYILTHTYSYIHTFIRCLWGGKCSSLFQAMSFSSSMTSAKI